MFRTFPIVLAHGIARFDLLSPHLFKLSEGAFDDGLHYFRHLKTHLENHGFQVRHSNVEWARGLRVRSHTLHRELNRILKETGAEKLHIIAHSMGGLDTRLMLYDSRKDGFFQKILSLTTIGTPHHGSSFADFLVETMSDSVGSLGLPIEGVRDLTTTAARKFNGRLGKWEAGCGVRFRAYAGTQPIDQIFNPLKIASGIIFSREGPNDGLVSLQSAKWSDEFFVPPVLDADHLNLIGWWEAAELLHGIWPVQLEGRIKALYLKIADDLAREFPPE